jgi:hypothetical protein
MEARHRCQIKGITMFGSNIDDIFKANTRVYKIGPSKKCQYKGTIESTKHSKRNSNIPEELV